MAFITEKRSKKLEFRKHKMLIHAGYILSTIQKSYYSVQFESELSNDFFPKPVKAGLP